MKKIILPVCLVAVMIVLGGCKHQSPYNRNAEPDSYERIFRRNIFAACIEPGKFYATYALAHLDSKPNEHNPCYKVTFVNGPCKGKTIHTNDVILKTVPVEDVPLVKGDIVLRDYWNPRQLSTDVDALNHWNRAVVYDTSRMDKGVVELEFPRDRNDFMAPREFIYVQNVRYIEKPEQKEMRTWL